MPDATLATPTDALQDVAQVPQALTTPDPALEAVPALDAAQEKAWSVSRFPGGCRSLEHFCL